MSHSPSFTALLRSELTRRCAQNEAYSLRAFARQLDIAHATLSQLLRGRRELTRETVVRLGAKLGLASEVVAAFAAELGAHPDAEGGSVVADAARIILDPVHQELLALVASAEFVADVRLIARILDVEVDAINVAVQRLARAGLLVMESSTRWTSTLDADVSPAAFEIAVWQHTTRCLAPSAPEGPPPAAAPSTSNPVGQFQLLTPDPAAAAAFYGHLFGWTIDDANPLGYRRIATGGLPGGIWPAPPHAPAFVQLFIEVRDVPGTLERATHLGAKVMVPVQTLPDGEQMAVLGDPQGISFGVYAPALRAECP